MPRILDRQERIVLSEFGQSAGGQTRTALDPVPEGLNENASILQVLSSLGEGPRRDMNFLGLNVHGHAKLIVRRMVPGEILGHLHVDQGGGVKSHVTSLGGGTVGLFVSLREAK